MRRGVFAAVLSTIVAASALLIAVPTGFAAPPNQSNQVKIDNFTFGPKTVTVPAGTTITWANRDDIPHTVVSTDNAFKSKVLDTDQEFSYTFTKPGKFDYFCSIHPKMTGTVVVQ